MTKTTNVGINAPILSNEIVLDWMTRCGVSLNDLVRKHSAFRTMDEMLNAIDYRPTLQTGETYRGRDQRKLREMNERAFIADAYNELQAERGDSRTAYCY